ncbi:MAG TPA: RNA 2'-phosphotransferase [Roseiflexaceae bacterium]|nr:RNA 2'-phosphotransferase [Roseiflexaceae bacterium]
MNQAQRTQLSKFMALLLRHRAGDYGLALDPEGFVPLAQLTGKRRDPQPAILRIDAARAHAQVVAFYQADNGVFLAKAVPTQYIEAKRLHKTLI